jgi:hypothetical protein
MSDTDEPNEVKIGAHSVAFREPDTYIIRQVDSITAQEIGAILDVVAEFIGDKPAVYAVIDQSNAGSMPSDARRVLLSRMSSALSGIVFTNVPMVARVGISLGYKAHLMMNRGKDLAYTFAPHEEDAHAWIVEQRKLHLKKSVG